MREIKFRVFDKKRNKMTYEDKRHWFNGAYMGESGFLQDCTLTTLLNNPNIDIEIMQYTGLKDKNGVEIYEGDIIEDGYLNPLTGEFLSRKYVIEYDKGSFRGKLIGHTPYGDTFLSFIKGEVIGNIYEDKHLLEEVANE